MDEQPGRARSPSAPQDPQTGGARPSAEPLDPLAAFCDAHGSVDSVGHFSPDTLFGDWRLTAFIGRGGNGEVYCAEHSTLGTPAAVKVLMRVEERAKARFIREAKLLSSLKSTAFPHFFAYGEANGHPYLAMELLEPGDLPTGDKAIAHFLLKVCDAVAELHARGFVHRDIKPSNILWRTGTTGVPPVAVAVPVLADLGLVKDLSTSDSKPSPSDITLGGVGTPGYGAPEQMERGEATVASDIHALGVLTDRCFNGNPPRAWARIIQCATSSIPAQRYPSVAAFARAVRWHHRVVKLWIAVVGVGVLAAVGTVLNVTRTQVEGQKQSVRAENVTLDSAKKDDKRAELQSVQTGQVIFASAILNGTETKDVRWFIDGAPVEMPHRVEERNAYNCPSIPFQIHAVVKRGNKTYSGKKTIVSRWQGERRFSMNLREDPDAGTSIRVWAPDGVPFDFVWCPPGEDVIRYVSEKGIPSKVRMSVGCGFWIATHELSCRQFGSIFGTNVVHLTPILLRRSIDRHSELPVQLEFNGPETVPVVYLNGSGVRFQPPDVLQWERAAQAGGGLPAEREIMAYAWTSAETNLLSHWDIDIGPVFKGGQKLPNRLGMYDVYGNVSEWALVSPALRNCNVSNRGGFMKMGGSCMHDYEGLRECTERVARLLHGLPVPVYNFFGRGEGSAGVRFVALTYFEHETNTVLYCAAKGFLRSDKPEDIMRGEAMLKEFLESDDSKLVDLSRECCVERGLLSLEACGTNAPSMLRLAAIRNGNPRVLEKLAVTDPDLDIREQAYERIKSPSQMLTAKFVARLEALSKPMMRDDMVKYSEIVDAMTDRSALSFVAEHANLGFLRHAARKRLSALAK